MNKKLSTFLFSVGTFLLCLNFQRVFGLAISDWFFFFSLFFFLINSISNKSNRFKHIIKNKNLFASFIILFGSLISMLVVKFYENAFMELFQQLYVIIFFTSLIWFLIENGCYLTIINSFIYSGVFTASIAIIDFFFNMNFGPLLSKTPNIELWERYAGTLGHPNKFGVFLVITSLFSFDNIIKNIIDKKRNKAFIYFIYFVLQCFGIYLSGSMTAMIGLIVGLSLYTLLNPTTKKMIFNRFYFKFSFFMFIFSIFLFIFINTISFESVIKNIQSTNILRAYTRIVDSSANSRIDIYQKAYYDFFKQPITGYGIDQLSTSSIPYEARYIDGTIHNIFLQILYSGGIITFLGWVLIYFNLFRNGIFLLKNSEITNNYSNSWILFATSISLFIMDQFQDTIYQREKWIVFGLLFSFSWALRNNINNNQLAFE